VINVDTDTEDLFVENSEQQFLSIFKCILLALTSYLYLEDKRLALGLRSFIVLADTYEWVSSANNLFIFLYR